MSQQTTQTTKSSTSNSSLSEAEKRARILGTLPEQPYKSLAELETHARRLQSAPNDTPDSCEVNEEVWGYITSPDDVNVNLVTHKGLKTFLAGTSKDIIKKNARTVQMVFVEEDLKAKRMTPDEEIELYKAKIENLQNKKR